MTEKPTAETPTFADAARRVEQRLVVRKGMHWALKTWPYAAGVIALLVALRLLGATFATATVALVLTVMWVIGCFVFAWKTRPGTYAAFSFWDRAAARSDAFANAWWFESQTTRTFGQELHLGAQASRLGEALKRLRADISLPDVRWLALIPLCALLIALLPFGNGLLPDAALTKAANELAAQEGKKLADKKLDADKMKALSEDEKKEMDKLQQKVQDTAKALQQDGAKTAREVLAELERSAHDAEKLASKLGAGDAAWASEQMTAEMRKHADTAELGDAAASKNAENTGKRAQELADKLNDAKLTNETRDRFSETLKDVGKQAQPEDKDRTVGQHVLNADKDMSQTLPQEAGKEFQQLADKMKTLAQREKAREQLEKLAQQLRESGSNIAGQGQQGMQQLAGNQGQQAQQNQSGQSQQSQQMQSMQNAQQSQPMQMPGMSNAPQGGQQGTPQNLPMMTPVPGTGQQKGMAAAPPNGKPGSGNNGKPMLIAPIPGMPPGQQPNAAILGMIPGSSAGLQAGNGVAPMDNKPTAATKAGQQGMVNAQTNADGASSVRAVEGQAHEEKSTRNSQAAALESIVAEENALDDAALPTARREQVRRYFTELRKRFEKSN